MPIKIKIFDTPKGLTCKDCLMYEKCSEYAYTQALYEGRADKVLMFIANRIPCKHFKNKADYAEVKHGEWQYNTDDFTPKMRCSVCGYNKPIKAGENINQEPSNYCPNCGAKMDGERKCEDG